MPDSSTVASLDLRTLARLYQAGAIRPQEVVAILAERQDSYPDPAVWIHRAPHEELVAQAAAVEKRRDDGERLALYGVPFAVKDNLDVADYPTTAACPAYRYVPERSAPVVDRLGAAGALFVGKTNLDQFGSGLAGDRSPYGACRNVFDPAYIAGGSSSGSAVAVAAGLVSFALGTDTAGSGRVPAGCNNIVGLKPTLGLLSTEGMVPACCSLDCVSVFALTASDAGVVCGVAAEKSGSWSESQAGQGPLCSTFAVPRDEDLEFFGDDGQAQVFQQTLAQMGKTGARRVAVDFKPFREVASLLYDGPWLAERLAGLGEFLREHAADVYPVTRRVIEGGARYSAVDVFQAKYRLKRLREVCLKIFDQAEVLVVPTLPTLPKLAEVQTDSAGWSRRLGYYTNFANLLQMAALAVPAGFTPQGLPGGITLLGPGGSDRRLCEMGMAWQRRSGLPLGATGQPLPTPEASRGNGALPPIPPGHARVAVAGAHLRGQPLHPDLRRFGARFVRACRTAGGYRFVALMDLAPPRPGLLRDDERPGAIRVEVYDLPLAGFGALVASVAPPLAIGTVLLEDGETVKGFLCESWNALRARDITEFGGWAAFRDHLGRHQR